SHRPQTNDNVTRPEYDDTTQHFVGCASFSNLSPTSEMVYPLIALTMIKVSHAY
ncbi:5849_t:CDS:1, partial [Funneliformis mosseae]